MPLPRDLGPDEVSGTIKFIAPWSGVFQVAITGYGYINAANNDVSDTRAAICTVN